MYPPGLEIPRIVQNLGKKFTAVKSEIFKYGLVLSKVNVKIIKDVFLGFAVRTMNGWRRSSSMNIPPPRKLLQDGSRQPAWC